jgi:hypothetical protein
MFNVQINGITLRNEIAEMTYTDFFATQNVIVQRTPCSLKLFKTVRRNRSYPTKKSRCRQIAWSINPNYKQKVNTNMQKQVMNLLALLHQHFFESDNRTL